MESIRSIFECLLGTSLSELSVTETFSECTAIVKGQVTLPLNAESLRAQLKWLPSPKWIFSVHLEGQESPHSLSELEAGAIETFLQGINDGAVLSSVASAKLFVEKKTDDAVDIFDPDALYNWLNSLEIPTALECFHQLIGERATVAFVHPTFSTNLSTGCFKFLPVRVAQPPASEAVQKRSNLFVARREQIVSDWSALRLFPDDFRWKNGQGIDHLEKTFAKLENFLCVVSLADSTVVAPDGFSSQIKSHVLRQEKLTWAAIPQEPDITLRNLFEWCYRDSGAGPLSDKLGLVRNYMSLYWERSVFGQDVRVVAAVRAGFGMYLKRNLKEFVELRAKVAAFLLELDARATKSVETATGNLEKNLYGVVTFVTSVVLLKALQDKTFTGAFSPQVALLGWTLIGFSAIHAIFAWRSADKEMTRATELYHDLKKLYDAFFSEKDFDSIFSSQGKNPIKKTKEYVRSRLISVMWVWGTTLVVAAGLIWYLRIDLKHDSNDPTMPTSQLVITNSNIPMTGNPASSITNK